VKYHKDKRFNTDGDHLETVEEDDFKKNSNVQPKAKIATFAMKSHLPQLKINIPLAISGNDVFEIFATICKNQRF
jgi:hypothetical protein